MYEYTTQNVMSIITSTGQSVVDEVATNGCGELRRVCMLVPGAVAWDECDCGQFAQTITSIVASDAPMTAATGQPHDNCGPKFMVVNVTASLVRCVPISSDSGQPPTCEALLIAAETMECDRKSLYDGIKCHLRDLYDKLLIPAYSIGYVNAVGPEGACAGVEVWYQFALINSCC